MVTLSATGFHPATFQSWGQNKNLQKDTLPWHKHKDPECQLGPSWVSDNIPVILLSNTALR